VTTDPEGDGDPSPRFDAELFWDDAAGVVRMLGAYAPNQGYLGDAWEFDGQSWRELVIPQPRGAAKPARLLYPAAAFDTVRRQVVVHGMDQAQAGWLTPRVLETWEWAPDARRPPSHVFRVDVSAARLDATAVLTQVDVRFVSGGTGYAADGTPVAGVALDAWSNRDFVSLTTSTDDESTPGEIAATITDPADIARYELSGELLFQVRPRDGSSPTDAAMLATDYAEVRIRYREP